MVIHLILTTLSGEEAQLTIELQEFDRLQEFESAVLEQPDCAVEPMTPTIPSGGIASPSSASSIRLPLPPLSDHRYASRLVSCNQLKGATRWAFSTACLARQQLISLGKNQLCICALQALANSQASGQTPKDRTGGFQTEVHAPPKVLCIARRAFGSVAAAQPKRCWLPLVGSVDLPQRLGGWQTSLLHPAKALCPMLRSCRGSAAVYSKTQASNASARISVSKI